MTGRTFLSSTGFGASPRYLKRAVDIAVGGLLVVIFAPVMAVVALALLVSSGRPVLFRQVRPGLNHVPWTMCKFRTMRPARDRAEFWHGDDDRTTKLGRFLRRTSLDEVPQFFNVLRGDMSMVGPRPPIPYELEAYDIWHRRRLLEVKPGITGLWQVSGRSELTFEEMVQLDIKYVGLRSIWLDARILARTMLVLIHRRGAA